MPDSVGISRRTGKLVTDWEHVVSSLEDLFTTRRLSRIMLRQYGSDYPDLIDAPMNELTLILFYSAIATAAELWEPRVAVHEVQFLDANRDGQATLLITMDYMPRGHLGDKTVAGTKSAEFVEVGGAFVAIS